MAAKPSRRLEEFVAPFRVQPGSSVALTKDFDPAFKQGMNKKEGLALLEDGKRRLSEYQARLAAQGTWGVLVVLQGIDAAGKDGTIRHVMSGVNPQGVSVHSFKGAPWYVSPADRKWFMRLAAGAVLLDALMDIDPRFPTVTDEQLATLLKAKQDLEAQAPDGAAPDPFEQQLISGD